ncbi:MAG TPA: hypothetical protein VGE06_10110, partial [Flavisolibacter sp.]
MEISYPPADKIFNIRNAEHRSYVEAFRSKSSFRKDFVHNFDYVQVYHASNLNRQEQDNILLNGIVVSDEGLLKQ